MVRRDNPEDAPIEPLGSIQNPAAKPPTDRRRDAGVRGGSLCVLVLLLCSGALALDPPSGTPFIARTLLDYSLTPHAVLVHRIDGPMITYTDSRGLLRREPTSEFLAILPGQGPTGWQRGGGSDILALVDGQRFPGVALPPLDVAEPPVSWDAAFARLSVPLESVSGLSRGGRATPGQGSTGDDTVLLSNGDQLSGFILALGPVVSIEARSGGAGLGVIDLPLDRIAWVRLANPAIKPVGAMLWLSDGTVACIEPLAQSTPESLEARLLPPGDADASLSEGDSPRLSIPLASVRAMAFDPGRLIGLGTLPLVRTSSDRPWTPGVVLSDAVDEPLGAPDITLPAPMSAAWALPASAIRVAFDALLPERSRTWGDAELVLWIEQDGTRAALTRARLDGQQPTASFNVPLPPPADARRDRRLVVELLAGPSGPAQDTVVLARPLVLLSTP